MVIENICDKKVMKIHVKNHSQIADLVRMCCLLSNRGRQIAPYHTFASPRSAARPSKPAHRPPAGSFAHISRRFVLLSTHRRPLAVQVTTRHSLLLLWLAAQHRQHQVKPMFSWGGTGSPFTAVRIFLGVDRVGGQVDSRGDPRCIVCRAASEHCCV